MHQIIMLDIPFQYAGAEDRIHPVILHDDAHMVLVDCGYTGFLPRIERAMQDHGLDCAQLTHVLVTHHDHDHMGALGALIAKYPHVRVVASEGEAPYISGAQPSLRLRQAQGMQRHLPPEQQAFGLAFCEILRNVQPVAVDQTVRGGDMLAWCGGCTIIDTAGHTPGHISLHLHRENVLIAGDAGALENGRPVIANPQFTLDMPGAAASLHKILSYGGRKLIFYHGGVYLPQQAQ